MNPPLNDEAVPIRRPHFHLSDRALYFLLSRRKYASLDDGEQAVWNAIDGKTNIAELRARFPALERVLERFVHLGLCDIPPSAFPQNRRRIIVIEPHMDDAALSVGGIMWLRRNQCEFVIVTLAGISNFTSYHPLRRDFFNIEQVTALRKAESALFVRHLGGQHVALNLLEAPLRYRNGNWTLDWFHQRYESVRAYRLRSPAEGQHEEWARALAEVLSTLQGQEIWMPLGLGMHVDHNIAREACLRIVRTKPELFEGRKIKFYEEVPYTVDWPQHAPQIIEVLEQAGARFEVDRVDIGPVMQEKMGLLSIFGSQFKVLPTKPRVEACARQIGADSGQYAEVLYEMVAIPHICVEGLPCYLDRGSARKVAEKGAPWLRLHRSSSVVSLFVPSAFGKWAEDIQFFLDFFPHAQLQVYMPQSWISETEALSSPRIVIKPVGARRWSWYAAAGRLLLSRPKPLVIVASSGKEHHARWLSAVCLGSDPIVATSLNALMLGLRLAGKTRCEVNVVSDHQPERNVESAASLRISADAK